MNAGPVFEEPELPLEPEDGDELAVEPQPLAMRATSGTDKRESNSVLPEFFPNIVGYFSFRRTLAVLRHPEAQISRCAKPRFLK
jgi:hypothetical protein